MSILSRFNALGKPKDATTEQRSWDPVYTQGAWNTNGVTTTETTALNYVAVYACVKLLAESIAALPIDTYQRTDSSPVPTAAPPWLTKPNVEQTTFELVEQIITSLALWGNAYVLTIRDDNGSISELWVINPARVNVERDRDANLVYRVDGSMPLTRDDLLHIRGLTVPGAVLGLSPIAAARQAIDAGKSADTYAKVFWENGAQPSGVLTLQGEADEESMKLISRAWNSQHQGSANAHKTALLAGGAEYKQISIPANDAQFLETRVFQLQEIARAYRIPPHMIGDLSRSTFSNIEHQSIDFVVHTLTPWLCRVEAALTSLLPGNATYVKFNEKALLRGDSAAQSEAFKAGLEHGWLTINDVRCKLDEPLLPASIGDVHFMPMNYTTIEQFTERLNKANPTTASVGVPALLQAMVITINEARADYGLPPLPDGDRLLTLEEVQAQKFAAPPEDGPSTQGPNS